MTRDERQQQCIESWRKNGGVGIIEACTGFGKTVVAMKICQQFNQKRPREFILIGVPTIQLKEQWEQKILEFGIFNVRVVVYNTLAIEISKIKKGTASPLYYDLLILDEIHKLDISNKPKKASKQSRDFNFSFSDILNKQLLKRKYVLGLSATLNFIQNRYILERVPIVDKVSLLEASENNWVSKYRNYVLYIHFNEEDKEINKEMDEEYNNLFSLFNRDYNIAKNCLNKDFTYNFLLNKYITEDVEIYNNLVELKYEHFLVPTTIGNARKLLGIIRNRKKLLYSHSAKKEIVKEIARELIQLQTQFICFSQEIEFTDELYSTFENDSIAYHSKIKAPKELKISTKNYKEYLLNQIRENKKLAIFTPVSLDEGADIPNLGISIVSSYTSKERQSIQRKGRVIRNNGDENKVAGIINIVTKNSQEEHWYKLQKGHTDKQCSSVMELLYYLKQDGVLRP